MTKAVSTRDRAVPGASESVDGQQSSELGLLPGVYDDEGLGAIVSSVMPAHNRGRATVTR